MARFLGEFRLPAVSHSIFIAGAIGVEVARAEQFCPEVCSRSRLALEEAVSNVVHHAYKDDNSDFTLLAEARGPELVWRIRDHGIPFELASGEDQRHGLALMESLVDGVRLVSLGRSGKELEIIVSRRRTDPVSATDPEDHTEHELTIRPLEPGDEVEISRCLYRTYGYSYLGEELYDRHKYAEMRRTGHAIAVVAECRETGDIAGHSAILLDDPEASIGEVGMVFVDPNHRGTNAARAMAVELLGFAAERGMRGLFALCTASHPYAQKAAYAQGAVPTGILLACETSDVAYNLVDQEKPQRGSEVLGFQMISPGPSLPVHIPPRHRDVTVRILKSCGVPFVEAENSSPDARAQESDWNECIFESANSSVINFKRVGSDAGSILDRCLTNLWAARRDVAYLYLPLDQPATVSFSLVAEERGFFYAGVLPYWNDVHAIVFQYINHISLRKEGVYTSGDEASQLLDYVWECFESSKTYF